MPKYTEGQKLMAKMSDGKFIRADVIYVDKYDKETPYLVSIGTKPCMYTMWKLSPENITNYYLDIRKKLSYHIGEYVLWKSEDSLYSMQEYTKEVNGDDGISEDSMNPVEEMIYNKVNFIYSLTNSVLPDVSLGANYKYQVSDKYKTKTALHNRLVQLRYEIKELDNLLYRI